MRLVFLRLLVWTWTSKGARLRETAHFHISQVPYHMTSPFPLFSYHFDLNLNFPWGRLLKSLYLNFFCQITVIEFKNNYSSQDIQVRLFTMDLFGKIVERYIYVKISLFHPILKRLAYQSLKTEVCWNLNTVGPYLLSISMVSKFNFFPGGKYVPPHLRVGGDRRADNFQQSHGGPPQNAYRGIYFYQSLWTVCIFFIRDFSIFGT